MFKPCGVAVWLAMGQGRSRTPGPEENTAKLAILNLICIYL